MFSLVSRKFLAMRNIALYSVFKFITNQGVPRMGQNLDDYPDFKQKDRGI